MTGLEKQHWGNLDSGAPVSLYTLRNSNGIEVRITNYGGRLVSVHTPDRQGNFGDIVLGFDDLAGYLGKNPYFGALVGRYANRIANGSITLDGKSYHLARNNGENALHGGLKGFDKVVWEGSEVRADKIPALELSYLSRDGEEGYPGNLQVKVRYTLTDGNELRIDYTASTDQITVLNLTNHSYFDLSGTAQGNIVDSVVSINANQFTPVNSHLIPTGELRAVDSTPFDFRSAERIGSRIDNADEQLGYGKGYDHNFVLNRNGSPICLSARAADPATGRVLEVFTTQPGMQFYTGNHLDGSVTGKGGKVYGPRSGMCFETQHFPDSPNQPQFPSSELKPGQTYKATTIFRFTTD
jgi:aldose 1-epimerase